MSRYEDDYEDYRWGVRRSVTRALLVGLGIGVASHLSGYSPAPAARLAEAAAQRDGTALALPGGLDCPAGGEAPDKANLLIAGYAPETITPLIIKVEREYQVGSAVVYCGAQLPSYGSDLPGRALVANGDQVEVA